MPATACASGINPAGRNDANIASANTALTILFFRFVFMLVSSQW